MYSELEELDFHLPGDKVEAANPTMLRQDEPELLHQQLVCWCLVQRYWYYCCDNPQVTDYEYDTLEGYVRELEVEFGFSNPYSPTHKPGSDRPWDYPRSLHGFFDKSKLGLNAWQYRVKYRASKYGVEHEGSTDSQSPLYWNGELSQCDCEFCLTTRKNLLTST